MLTKSPKILPVLYFFLTNSPLSFQSSGAVKTKLYDYHEMAFIIMKTIFQKLNPKVVNYRDYRKYCNDSFRQDLLSTMIIEILNLSSDLQKFLETFTKTLYKFAPQKNKYSRGNNKSFVCKLPSPAHMKRIPLRHYYI